MNEPKIGRCKVESKISFKLSEWNTFSHTISFDEPYEIFPEVPNVRDSIHHDIQSKINIEMENAIQKAKDLLVIAQLKPTKVEGGDW